MLKDDSGNIKSMDRVVADLKGRLEKEKKKKEDKLKAKAKKEQKKLEEKLKKEIDKKIKNLFKL